MEKHSPSRRTVVKGAAWAVPAVTIAATAPALAVSGRVPNIAPVTIPGAGQPADEPLVITDEKGEVFTPETITNVTGLPDGVQIVKKEDGTFAIVGVVADNTPAGTVPVTAVVTGDDGKQHEVSFDVTIGEPEELCEGSSMSWPATYSIYQGLAAEIRTPEGDSANETNVPLEVTPKEGTGALKSVAVSGLPAGLSYDSATKRITGVTYETGTFPIMVQYTTDQNVGCALQMSLTVVPTAVTRLRITENNTMTPGQAGINGLHVTNTSDAPITEMTIRIYAYYKGNLGASTITSFDYPNITTLTSGDSVLTGGPTEPWRQPRTAILERAQKGEAGAYGFNTNGTYPKGASERAWDPWFPDGSSRNALVEQSAWNFYVRETNLDTAREQAGDGEHIRPGTVGWVYRLVPGSSIAPGETFHFQLGYAGPNAFYMELGMTVEANGDKQHVSTSETGWFKHSDWNVADAEPRREPGTWS
ncbi:MAG: putative Ig domain-containing protein [Actinomycetaceae bacterium]|nr:putative Ig domain-containing protein [Actinomycetaceae bacterium]